jgi:hypothetical protein
VPDDHAQPTPAALNAIERSLPADCRLRKNLYHRQSPGYSGADAANYASRRRRLANGEFEQNPPIAVYDTSGPYTDRSVQIDVRKGLAPLRDGWIDERADSEELAGCPVSLVVVVSRIR